MNNSYTNLSDQYSNKVEGYYEFTRPEMLPYIPANAKTILEVGCSGGRFGRSLRETRPEIVVWGIEPDTESAERAKENLNHVICSTFEPKMSELDGKRFDCIIFNDVLEHLVNPDKALKTCHEYLNENGVVVASIPNILFFYQIKQILMEQDWKYENAGIMDNTHLRFFTKKSIIRLFEESGYNIEKIEGINSYPGRVYRLANIFFLGKLHDWRYVQFAVQAKIDRTT